MLGAWQRAWISGDEMEMGKNEEIQKPAGDTYRLPNLAFLFASRLNPSR